MRALFRQLALMLILPLSALGQSMQPIKMQLEILEKETPLIFLGEESALKAYLGIWEGRQDLFEPANGNKKLADFSVRQVYEFGEGGALSCSASVVDGRGRVNLSYSEIAMQDGELILSLVSGMQKIPTYRGFVRGNSVFWYPYRLIFLLNVQEDKFFLKKCELIMYSHALQHVYNFKKQYEGFLAMSAKFTKIERAKEPEVEAEKPEKPKRIELSPLLDKNFFKGKN